MKMSVNELLEYFPARVVGSPSSGRYFPRSSAPVYIFNRNQWLVTPMQFSMIPSWSDTEKPKFATYNARIESLFDKPTWKDAITKSRCLVPMTGFLEWVENEETGKKELVEFTSETGDPLFACGVWSRWQNEEKSIDSFAIVTKEPVPEIEAAGHDRMPLFLKKQSYEEWSRWSLLDQENLFNLAKEELEVKFKVKRFDPESSAEE